MGLVITAVVIFVEAFWAGVLAIRDELHHLASGQVTAAWQFPEEHFWVLFGGTALLVLLITGTMLRAAVNLARFESFELVMLAVILAMVPFSFHVLIGLPFGLWAMWILSRPEVKAAFALNLQYSHGRGVRRGATRGPTGAAYGMVRSALGAMLTLIVHRPTAASSSQAGEFGEDGRRSEQARQTPLVQARRTSTDAVPRSRKWVVLAFLSIAACIFLLCASPVIFLSMSSNRDRLAGNADIKSGDPRKPPLAFHRGNPKMIDLWTPQPDQLDEILRSADEEYLRLEARHTRDLSFAKNNLTIAVLPFQEEVKELENRVWLEIGVLLYPIQMKKAKLLLPIHGSLFPLGKERFEIEFMRRNNEVGWRVLGQGGQGEVPFQFAPQLPPEYARFWRER